MVDRWAKASRDARARAFDSAFAVRQIEIGFASLLSVLFGFSIAAYGTVLLFSPRFPRCLGWLGFVGGLATVAAGIAQAYTGFSAVAMMLSMPAGAVLLLSAITVGVFMWRLAPLLEAADSASNSG